jgi:hypothetical protein
MSSRTQRFALLAVVLATGLQISATAFAATVVVTSTADTLTTCATLGVGRECTLRDAITFSNAHPQLDESSNLIQFDIPGSGVQTIGVNSALPAITYQTIIDGYSQPGASPNTLAVGSDAVLLISVLPAPASHLGAAAKVIDVAGGTGSVIEGLVVNGIADDQSKDFADPIFLDSCCNRIVGNFVGVDPTGTMSGVGDLILQSSRNQIGGRAPADRNVLQGLLMFPAGNNVSKNNVVSGNYLGTNAAGNAALAGHGVLLFGASFCTIGPGNVISGNAEGIAIHSGVGNLITGNFIGTDATGTLPVPNGFGVDILDGQENAIGTPPGPPLLSLLDPGNRIAFNSYGVTIVSIFGASSNSILGNSIFSNDHLGIDLGADGVTPNDPGDSDSGANNLQNYPVLTTAAALKFHTEVFGTLDSMPNTEFRIQIFSNSSCDPSGFGQGETFAGEAFVTTDGSGHASFQTSVSLTDAPVGRFITSTATDPGGNTSEFSACQPVVATLILTRTRFLVEGPVRVAPGVPVEFSVQVLSEPRAPSEPTGEVLISDGVGQECRARLSNSGEGACSLTFPGAGGYRVRSRYEGSGVFAPSSSPPLEVIVGKAGGGR